MKRENSPIIETPRLILRKFEERDVDDIFAIYSDEAVNEFLPWFPLKSIEEARIYLHDNIFADYAKSVAYRYAVELKQTGRVIGYVSLCGIDERTQCGDLGYGLRRDYWNKGIITEAAAAVLQRLRDSGFAYITATHDVNNPKSGAVMEKIGMTYVRAYEEMWQPKNFKVTFKLYRIDFKN